MFAGQTGSQKEEKSPLLPSHQQVYNSSVILNRVGSSASTQHDNKVYALKNWTAQHQLGGFRRYNLVVIILLATVTAFFIACFNLPFVSSSFGITFPAKKPESDNYNPGAPADVQKLWAAYAPYYSVEEYKPPPRDCRINQVNILQRHGARFPTIGLARHIAQALTRLQAAQSFDDKRLEFITHYTYELGTDDLVPLGELQSFESGRKAFKRYANLINAENVPFVRAAGSDRVVQSARNWTQGFTVASGGHIHTPLALIIPEEKGVNNSLHDTSCPAAGRGDAQLAEWQSVYAKPIADRFNAVARGLPTPLEAVDAQSLIALCALETAFIEEYSQFCKLFTKTDFAGFEYALDLEKFYLTGYGQELGPVQGVGYVNELLARLTDQPVKDRTQTNHTLDSNPTTFPLGRGVYTDFTHDNLIVSVLSAMGLFKASGDDDGSLPRGKMLDPRKPDKRRPWVISRMTPFSGRLLVERMECGLSSETQGHDIDIFGKGKRRRHRREEGIKSYIRIIVNDAVQKLDFCEGADEDGLCLLENFVKSQEYARENGKGDWEKCFVS